MDKTLLRLLIAQASLFSVNLAPPLVSIFYCMSTTAEQATSFSLSAALIFVIVTITQCIIVNMLYRPVGSKFSQIADPATCSDAELIKIAHINSALPVRLSILFLFAITIGCTSNYLVYRMGSIGVLSASSIWGGAVAGALACPLMVLGTASLILGKNTELIAAQILKRKLDFTPGQIKVFPKLFSCFIGIALGLSIWLGSAAFYTGVNQTIEEIKFGNGQWLKTIALSMDKKSESSNPAALFGSIIQNHPDRRLFLADSSGKLLASSHSETLEIKRWTSQKKQILAGLSSANQGHVYDNVNERVISWHPMGDEYSIGTFSYINKRLSRYTQFFIWSGIFIIVGLSVGIALGITNVLATTKSIHRAVDVLKDLAQGEGDLTIRLPVTSNDEVGDLARWSNTFIDKLYLMIQSIVGKSDEIRLSSKNFSEISQSMNRDITSLQNDTAHVSHVVEETSHEFSTVSSASNETASNVNNVSASAEEMATSIQEVAQRSEEARKIAEEAVVTSKNASSKIQKLGSAAKDIDKVTEVITEISEQINLLALNATIEAARAGEAGKGFSVVAEEIKELARQTAKATNEIKQRVNGIQMSTDDTIEDMGSISSVIESVNEFVNTIAGAMEEQTLTTREMASMIAQVSNSVSEVNQSITKNAQSSQEMSSQMEQVHSKAESISQNSSQVDKSSRDLLSISEMLNEQVSKFKL